jgi:hypothetical protein
MGLMDCDGVLRLLDDRQAACRAQMERLREEAERIAELLDACGLELERVSTAREVVAGLSGVTGGGQERAAVSVAEDEPEGFTDQVLAVLAGRGAGMRCRELAEALGEDAGVARKVERMRHRMKRLVRTGRIVECEPGMFTLAPTGGHATG